MVIFYDSQEEYIDSLTPLPSPTAGRPGPGMILRDRSFLRVVA